MIQERFDELQPYLKGVKISDEFIIVESMIKPNWKIRDILPDDVEMQTKEENRKDGLRYHMFYSKERTVDSLIDVLEMVINTNIELEQKQELLKAKVEELKKMFQDKSLEELMLLKFSSEMDVDLKVKKPEVIQDSMTKPLNGFNNGRDTTEGVGGKKVDAFEETKPKENVGTEKV